jgi:hypothetical protein
MKIDGTPYRAIWLDQDGWSVRIIDQTKLPWSFEILRLTTLEEAAHAIRAMLVRGAPLIGAAAAYGLCLGLRADPGTATLARGAELLMATRPTAVNLAWAIERMRVRLENLPPDRRVAGGDVHPRLRIRARSGSARPAGGDVGGHPQRPPIVTGIGARTASSRTTAPDPTGSAAPGRTTRGTGAG